MKMQCRTKSYYAVLLSFLIASVFVLGGCTNPEKAKAEHLSRGEAYLKDSKFQEASIEFRNAVQIDDKLAAAHWGLARAYEGLQRYQETFEELKKTVALDPNNLEARINLGNYYLVGSKGKSDVIAEAEKLANEILAKDQNHIEGHILKGSVLYAQGKPAEAFAELNHAVELDPKRSESYLSLARFYIVNKEPAKAEETYQRAIAANPNSALAHTEWGKYLVGANKFPEAEAALKKAVEVEPTNRAAHYYLASFYLVSKQLDKAEAAYRELANFDKDKPEGQAIMGDFYSSVNRLDEAAKIYEDILSKSPEYSQGRYRLAEINLARGDRKKAGDQIDELLKKDQRDRHALLLRARVNASTNDSAGLKLAIDDLKEVLKQEPNSKAGLYFMAQANFNLGLIDQARAFAADLERNYPDYLPAKLTLIQISLATGDTKGATRLATELLDRLSRTGPDRDHSPQILNEIQTKTLLARGSAAAQSGNIAAARQDFMAASALSPKNTDVYANLAALSTLENKSEEAAGFYEKALAIDATNFNAMSGILGLHVRANAFDKAHSRVDQALSSYPNNASMHYLKAQIYGAERNQQGAETELRKTLELDANYIAAAAYRPFW